MKEKMNFVGVSALLLLIGATFLFTGCQQEKQECEHSKTSWKVIEQATCENSGKRQKVCIDCGMVLEEGIIAQKKHEYECAKCIYCGEIAEVETTTTFGLQKISAKSMNTEPIEWIVLDVQDGKVLLITRYAINYLGFNETEEEEFGKWETWENCSLRQWLNGEFYSTVFSEEEQSHILLSYVTADANPYRPQDEQGNDTEDKVFLLSVVEVEKYFVSQETRRLENGGSYSPWWLRTKEFVQPSGEIGGGSVHIDDYRGYDVFSNSNLGVRPAIWVSIE